MLSAIWEDGMILQYYTPTRKLTSFPMDACHRGHMLLVAENPSCPCLPFRKRGCTVQVLCCSTRMLLQTEGLNRFVHSLHISASSFQVEQVPFWGMAVDQSPLRQRDLIHSLVVLPQSPVSLEAKTIPLELSVGFRICALERVIVLRSKGRLPIPGASSHSSSYFSPGKMKFS